MVIFFLYSQKNKAAVKLKQSKTNIESLFSKAKKQCDTYTPQLTLLIRYLLCWFISLCKYLNTTELSIKITTQKIIEKKSLLPNRAFCILYRRSFINAMVNGNNSTIKQINACSKELSAFMSNYEKQTNRRLLLYPMHIFSDELPIIVALHAIPNDLYVISDVNNDEWNKKWGDDANKWKEKNQRLILFNPFEKTKKDASKGIRNIIKKTRSGRCNFAVFPDAMPEYTQRLDNNHTYIKTDLFGRQATLHSGPFNFPKLMQCDILPYYIYIKHGTLKINLMEPIAHEEVNQKLPQAIEKAINSNFKQWILWHFFSFFYRNG